MSTAIARQSLFIPPSAKNQGKRHPLLQSPFLMLGALGLYLAAVWGGMR